MTTMWNPTFSTTSIGSLTISQKPGLRRRSSSMNEVTSPYNKKSFVPIIAPVSPPLSPLEGEITYGSEASFEEEPQAFQAFPGVTVAVIGTGYVGLHLVEAFSTAYNVIAFDVYEPRIQEIQSTVASHVQCTSNPSLLREATHFLISVSTILDAQKHTIDISCIEKAIETIAKYARPGSTVVIESSVSVGMTRSLMEPLIKSKGLKCGMSPERVDPGRTYPTYDSIPKIISGLDEDSLSSITDLYSRVFQNLVPVSKPEVAEMTKLYENTQRMMCIAYVNEMSDACRQLSLASQTGKGTAIEIDPWEVANAAATKPFGYMPYYPSLGVGGHCIPVNPYYLLAGAEFPLLETCTKRMEDRPARMGDQLMETLTPKSNKRASILVVGMGFKKGQSVLSHSPGKALAVHLLSTYDVHVEFADPLVEQKAISFIPRFEDASWNEETLEKFDAIVVAVDQPGYDYELLDRLQATGTKVQWFTRR